MDGSSGQEERARVCVCVWGGGGILVTAQSTANPDQSGLKETSVCTCRGE